MNHARLMMTHHAYSHGRASLIDADLTGFAEQHKALHPVFEELQYLRQRVEELESELVRERM